MSEFYRVSLAGQPVRYVHADSKPEARRVALSDLSIERLSGSEVAALIESGATVTEASSPAGGVAPEAN